MKEEQLECMTHYTQVLVKHFNIKDYEDLMDRVSNKSIHVGIMIAIGDITSNYESIRLTQHQLDWLIYETKLSSRA